MTPEQRLENFTKALIESAPVWAEIPGYEGQYMISEYGKIRRMEHTIISKAGIKRIHKAMDIQYSRQPDNPYFVVALKKRYYYVHKLVGMAFIPNPENKEQVNHKDFNKRNNHVSNLEWVTRKENAQHALLGGRLKLNTLKLTKEQVIEIRKIDRSVPSSQVAKRYNISSSNIRQIRQGKWWKNVIV